MGMTKAVIEYFGEDFHIPSFQRGYRWGEQEVRELLDDLYEFKCSPSRGMIYCLQPIVLKERPKGGYYVLDGQQRLTTIYLILEYLENEREREYPDKKLFTLNYETRENCKEFLEEKRFATGNGDENIDFYHMCEAYKAIDKWFKSQQGAQSRILAVLMDRNKSEDHRNAHFIHYEVKGDEADAIDAFIRLNVGKIPLTNAELIKALFLQQDVYGDGEKKIAQAKLNQIAVEWDKMEYKMQEEEFWFFINALKNDKPTHIEFIFDLYADEIWDKPNFKENYFDSKKPLKNATFLIFSKYLDLLIRGEIDGTRMAMIDAIEQVWGKITKYFEIICDFYQDRELFHHIGFLIAVDRRKDRLKTLIQKSLECKKSEFKEYLKSEIGEIIQVKEQELEDLDYEDDSKEINNILLLHNVVAANKSDKERARFPFHLYNQTKNKNKWSLEHIHARKSEDIKPDKTWLIDHIDSLDRLNKLDNKGKADNLIIWLKELSEKQSIEVEEFKEAHYAVFDMIDDLSGEKTEEDKKHLISNLCLVDVDTNSALNNSVFDEKREKIIKREKDGTYIPICTRNVFFKAYTERPKTITYWTKDDRDAYLNDIKNVYYEFIKAIKKGR
jgi:hypothetical protein